MPPWAHKQVKGGQDAKLGFLINATSGRASRSGSSEATGIKRLPSNSRNSGTDINSLAHGGEASTAAGGTSGADRTMGLTQLCLVSAFSVAMLVCGLNYTAVLLQVVGTEASLPECPR